MANKLFVAGIPWATTDEDLRNIFSEAGTVVSANVIKDKFTGKSRGFGFVEMSTPEEAAHAIEVMNGKEVEGRPITVNEARPQEPRENRGGFQNRGGYDRHDNHGGRDNRGGRR